MMRSASIVTLAFALVGAGIASTVPVKRADLPTSVHIYVQDSASEDITYITSSGLGYQLFFENFDEGVSLPPRGTFTVEPIDGSWSSDGNQVDVHFTSSGNQCSTSAGFIECFGDATTPTTFTLEQQFNNGFFDRDFWYLQGDWLLTDAHEDDIRDGSLAITTNATDRARHGALYLVSA